MACKAFWRARSASLSNLRSCSAAAAACGAADSLLCCPYKVSVWQLMLPLLRADFSVVETYSYRPGAPLDCPVTVFGGLQDAEVSRQDLEAWGELTNAAFSLRMLAGDHFFLNTPSTQELLLRSIAQQLQKYLQHTA
jgi:surfactin synthase thioesterase subunit